jgi:hypothetical protein
MISRTRGVIRHSANPAAIETPPIEVANAAVQSTEHPAIAYSLGLFQEDDYILFQLIHSWKTHVVFDKKIGQPLINKETGQPRVEADTKLLPLVMVKGAATPEYMNSLMSYEAQGWNIYICMNPFPAGTRTRTESLIEVVRNLFLDVDKTKENGDRALLLIEENVKAGKIPQPHSILESSPGNYHVVWCVDDFSWEEAKGTLPVLAALLGGDPSATDLNRVLRMPGFKNQKSKHNGWLCRLLEPCLLSDVDPYNKDQFDIHVTPENRKKIEPSSEAVQKTVNYIIAAATEAQFDLGGEEEDRSDGGVSWLIECPWADKHTTGSDTAMLMVLADGRPEFNCFHGHCNGTIADGVKRGWSDIRKLWESKAGHFLRFGDENTAMALVEGKTRRAKSQSQERKAFEKAGLQEPPPTSENIRETSLFIFKNQEDARLAIDGGLKSTTADEFKVGLDFAFHRVVYVGDDRDPSFGKIYNAMKGQGVVSVKRPKAFSLESLEKILNWDAIKLLSIANPKMAWMREDILQQTEGYALEFKYPAVEGTDFDFILGPMMGASEGWCPRGDPHIIAGPSGGSKTTLMMDLLQAQLKKERFLGHETYGLPYLVVMADRGIRAFRRTMKRMGIDYTQIPTERLRMVRDAGAIWAILRKIEECNPRPAIVFVEGADMLVKDASKMEIVTPFMDALQRIAFHYHIAFVVSVGSPKQKVGENYVAKRDQVIGTIAWGRMADTIVVMQYLEGDDTDRRRSVSVLLRNSMAEKYKLAFENGRLIPDNHVPESKPKVPSEVDWFRAQPGWFTAMDLKEALNAGKSWAYECVAENLTKRVLKTKKMPRGETRQYHWNEGKSNPFLRVDVTFNEPKNERVGV